MMADGNDHDDCKKNSLHLPDLLPNDVKGRTADKIEGGAGAVPGVQIRSCNLRAVVPLGVYCSLLHNYARLQK